MAETLELTLASATLRGFEQDASGRMVWPNKAGRTKDGLLPGDVLVEASDPTSPGQKTRQSTLSALWLVRAETHLGTSLTSLCHISHLPPLFSPT